MSIIYLTSLTLDVIGGAAIWTITKTYNGVYYLLYGSSTNDENKVSINKELFEELVEDNKKYRNEIKKLGDEINTISDYVKNIHKKDSL
mgnify:CR=1 FL=1|tara:strand:+ start:104 stop:370 length:267 start_codon:yes stop_codon:yes gene_type:complete